MIKKQTNQNSLIAEQFSEIVRELSSLNKKELNEKIKMLTKGESVSHLFHQFNPKSNSSFLFNSAKSKLYLDLVIATRIKSFNSPSFLLFNYSDDGSDLYKFFDLLSFYQKIKDGSIIDVQKSMFIDFPGLHIIDYL